VSVRIFVALALLSALTPADEARQKEYKVKAGALIALPGFTTYPKARAPKKDSVVRIGVIGEHPICTVLLTFNGKKRGTRTLEVKAYRRPADAKKCHVIFVCAAKRPALAEVFRALKGQPVLICGDEKEFAVRGGMIGFRIDKGKVRLDINRAAIARAGLRLHPRLLQLGRLVKERPRK